MEGFSRTSSPRRVYTVVSTVLKVQKESMGGKPIVVMVIATHTYFSTLIIDTNKINRPFYPLWLPFTA
jgi:hypothetical protein